MQVKCATSFDERFNPSEVLNTRDMRTFWMTTGLYPQEVVIQIPRRKLTQVKFATQGARKVVIEGCKDPNAQTFTKIGESKELAQRNGIQTEAVTISDAGDMEYVKFIIQDGWEEFTSVHSVEFA